MADEKTIIKCKKCGQETEDAVLRKHGRVCPCCGNYFRLNARERISLVVDRGTFREHDASMKSENIIGFPEYDDKLEKAIETTGEKDAVVTGHAKIGGIPAALFVMDSNFMMASMGTVVGEKITRVFEYATENRLPVVGFICSGGARMQEGVLSLMQMAKVSAAVRWHNDAGLFYLPVLTDPTTGGVTASYAMEGDIIAAEPGALIGFAGQRVIEQTTGEKLPKGFQSAEFQLEHGFVDLLIACEESKNVIGRLLTANTAAGRKFR